MKNTILFLFACVTALSSCGSSTDNSSADNGIGVMLFDTLAYSHYYRPDTTADSDAYCTCTTDILLHYPIAYSDTLVLRKIQRTILAYMFSDTGYLHNDILPQDAAENYFDDDNCLYWCDSIGKCGYEYVCEGSVVYADNILLSYAEYFSEYMCGERPHYYTHYFVFRMKTGELLVEQDIFVPNYEEELTKILTQQAIDAEMFLFDNIEEISSSGNFFLTDSSIIFSYEKYSIAPGVMGEPTIELPYSKIYHILNPNSPVRRKWKNVHNQ